MARPATILAFDLYGTLLSTNSIGKTLYRILAQNDGDKSPLNVAKLNPRWRKANIRWRNEQLSYTWRLNSMKIYQPFSEVTRNSLQAALAAQGLSLDDQGTEAMMEAYHSLNAFKDVSQALPALAKKNDLRAVIFSNGTTEMVTKTLKNSPDLSPYATFFSDVISVEDVKYFKPMPEVYQHLARKVGKVGAEKEIHLISGNPFDITGAHAAGLTTIWLNRSKTGWVDTLMPSFRPDIEIRSLRGLLEILKA